MFYPSFLIQLVFLLHSSISSLEAQNEATR